MPLQKCETKLLFIPFYGKWVSIKDYNSSPLIRASIFPGVWATRLPFKTLAKTKWIFFARLSTQTLQWQLEEILITLGWGRGGECVFISEITINTSLKKQTISTLLMQNNINLIDDSCSITGDFSALKRQKGVYEDSLQIPVDLLPLTFWVTSEILECCCK